MTLSTSNSKQIPKAFLITLAILCAFRAVDFWLPPSPFEHSDDTPITSDYYLAYSGGSVEHSIIYNGDEGVLEPLKKADVLFVGNSRVMAAFPKRNMEPFFKQLGLHYYMMGFTLGEHCKFSEVLIRKHDLHPKLVVINTGYFFIPALSPAAEDVIHSSHFDDLKVRWEIQAANFVWRIIGCRSLIRIFDWQNKFAWQVYRSKSDGTWVIKYIKSVPKKVNTLPLPAETRELTKENLDAAKSFKEMLEKRGAQIVLTNVPTAVDDHTQTETVAKYLDLPLITLPPEGLDTVDGSHLDRRSVDTFDAGFFEKFRQYLQEHPLK